MLFARLLRFGFLPVLVNCHGAHHIHRNLDPCSKIAGKDYVDPLDAESCLSSFPSNDTLKNNVLSIVSGSLDFFTWEAHYLNLPPPFHKESWDIRAKIRRINQTRYDTDYQFNRDLFEVMNRLNDGHTYFQPNCYLTYRFIIPTPIVLLDTGIYIAPDIVTLFGPRGPDFTAFYEKKGFDWKRLAGARVHKIGGLPAWEYIDYISDNVVGIFLDHNVRVNSVFSSYTIQGSVHKQSLGFLASRNFLMETSLEFTVVPVNTTSNEPECVKVPFVALYNGAPFKDKESFWANNCVVTETTNGVDRKPSGSALRSRAVHVASIPHPMMAVDLPYAFNSTISAINRTVSGLESHILPGNRTGVLYVGSFTGDYNDFQRYIHDSVQMFKNVGVENIVVDVTNNPGGYLCLGFFLHQYLAGTNSGIPVFQSTSRANPLAQKIVKSLISLNVNETYSFYAPDRWQFVNGTPIPNDFDYNDPPIAFSINHRQQPTSQRFEDICPALVVTVPETPPFDLEKVVIIGNGFCASTCAIFTTGMRQKHDIKIATFGGQPNRPIEYKGVAGNEVLEWAGLDSEIKTAELKDDFPQEFIVNATVSINWRTDFSTRMVSQPIWRNLEIPVNFESDPSQIRLNYTNQTYNDPQKNWLYVEKLFFH